MIIFYSQSKLIALTAVILLSNLCISKSDKVHFCPDKTEKVCGQQSNYECGSVAPKTIEISKNGNKINFTIVPWNAEFFFLNEFNMNKYYHGCSGTIISKKWIISVAHSFWDFVKKKFKDLKTCTVFAGATGLDYYSDDDFKMAQKRSLKKFISSYNGVYEPQNDVAAIELATDLDFTDTIHHVCVQFAEGEENAMQSDFIGAFAGRVYLEDKTKSDEQLFVITETTSHEECKKDFDEPFSPLFGNSTDVICLSYCLAGIRYYTHGAGFVTLEQNGDKHRYSLAGIISFGNYEKNCSTDPKQIVISGQSLRSIIKNSDRDGYFEIQRTTITATMTPAVSAFGNFCRLPSNQEHLIVEDLSGNVIASGALVPANTFIKFKCDTNYFLEGELQNVCIDSQWNFEIPSCVKYCNKTHLTAKISSRAVCHYHGSEVPCNDRIRAETQAQISCATGFIAPKVYRGFKVHKTLTCGTDGNWNYDKYSCNMQCGRMAPQVQEYIGGGSNRADVTETPWHVGIYQINNGTTYSYICGGTIITPNLVISAAHCFWDEVNERLYHTSLYSIAAGKYFREYNSNEEFFPAQKRNISEIHIQSSFKGVDNNYLDDIAVVRVTSHFEFTDTILPVCIQFLERGDQDVPSNLTGNFAGWGINKNQGPSSNVLQSISMQTLSYRECGRELKSKFPNYKLPNDKFCLNDENIALSNHSISGGGFVVSSIDSNNKFYYNLIGVAGHGPTSNDLAQGGVAVVMTNVHYFKSLIDPVKFASEEEF